MKTSQFRKGINRASKYKARYQKAKYQAKRRSNQVVFTETFVNRQGILATNTGYNLTFKPTDIPQMAQYSNLYARFRIKKAEFHLIPLFNSANVQGGLAPITLSRIAYSVNDTPAQVAPSTELQVLQDNGCKVKLFDKKIKITCYPKPDLYTYNSLVVGSFPAITQKKLFWLNTDNGNNLPASSGTGLDHGGVSVFLESPNNIDYCNVITKVWIQLADPQ